MSKKFSKNIHTIGINTIGTKVTQKLKNSKKAKIGKNDEKDEKKPLISVFRSSVRSHATHAIGELKNCQDFCPHYTGQKS